GLVVPEIERGRHLTRSADELDAVLLDEGASLHLVEHLEPPQHPVGFRDKRLADMETREALAFIELDAMALLGDQRRHRAPRRPAANDDDICCICALSWAHSLTPPGSGWSGSGKEASSSRYPVPSTLYSVLSTQYS